MAVLFLVNTPAQVMNAAVIAMTLYSHEECDAYFTENVSREVESLARQNVFKAIYEIELVKDILQRKNILSRALVRIKNALDIDLIIRSLPTSPLKYSRVFVSGVSLRNFEYYYAVKKINKRVSLSLYEEGIYEYYELGVKKSYFKILFSKIFFGQYYLNNCDSVYVHNPKFVQNIWSNITVKEIPSYSSKKEIIKTLNLAFEYNKTQMEGIHNKFIVIEQAFSNPSDEERQKELISLLVRYVGTDRVFIKMHPRSSSNKYKNVNIIDTRVPLEIIGMNEDIFDNVYVSIVSSAIANFKLFLNKEPNVIMLYELLGGIQNKNVNILFEHLKNSYNNGAFYTPKNITEFINQIGHLNV